MELPMKLSISQVHSNCGDGYIQIKIQDELSNSEFVRLNVPFSEFAQCLTGSAFMKCTGEVCGLDNVGKKMEMDNMVFEIPSNIEYKDRKSEAYRIACELAPEGWEPDSYFGSQNSFFQENGKSMARTTIRRWV